MRFFGFLLGLTLFVGPLSFLMGKFALIDDALRHDATNTALAVLASTRFGVPLWVVCAVPAVVGAMLLATCRRIEESPRPMARGRRAAAPTT